MKWNNFWFFGRLYDRKNKERWNLQGLWQGMDFAWFCNISIFQSPPLSLCRAFQEKNLPTLFRVQDRLLLWGQHVLMGTSPMYIWNVVMHVYPTINTICDILCMFSWLRTSWNMHVKKLSKQKDIGTGFVISGWAASKTQQWIDALFAKVE